MNLPAFQTLTICGLDELNGHQDRGVTHILSILDPEWPEPSAFQAFDPHFRAIFRFHDAIEPDAGVLLPERADVEAILAFGRDAGEAARLLAGEIRPIDDLRSSAAYRLRVAQNLVASLLA